MSEGFKHPEKKENLGELTQNELRSKLDWALTHGTLAALESLFDAGMDINQQDWDGRTAIQMLTAKGNKEGVEMALSRGADVNHVYMYHDRLPQTALDAAQEMNRREIEDLLLAHGAKTGEEM